MARRNKLKRNKALIILPVLLVMSGIAFAYFMINSDTAFSPEPVGVDLSPPSQSDRAEAENHKENLSNPSTPTPTNAGEIKKVTPVITSWGQSDKSFELAALVPSIYENGGRCVLMLRKDGKIASGTSLGTQNVSEVTCGFIKIPLSSLTSGVWSATVSYKSTKAQGSSSSLNVMVK